MPCSPTGWVISTSSEDDARIAARELNLAVAVQDGAEVFLRRLVPGGADRSYGLHVARLAGVPEQV